MFATEFDWAGTDTDPLITTMQTLPLDDITRPRWLHLYPIYFDFILYGLTPSIALKLYLISNIIQGWWICRY